MFKRFLSQSALKNEIIFENKDKLLLRASYFALICQTIFWTSIMDMAIRDPDKESMKKYGNIALCSVGSLLFPGNQIPPLTLRHSLVRSQEKDKKSSLSS
jgi:hypothetical protein